MIQPPLPDVRVLGREEASALLDEAGYSIGQWANIVYRNKIDRDRKNWDCIRIPTKGNPAQLLLFAQKLIDWLPESTRYIVQFDHSSRFSADQLIAFSVAIPRHELVHINKCAAFCFKGELDSTRLALAYVSLFCLMFEGHGYIASLGAHAGNYLGLQDGFVYIISKKKTDVIKFKKLLEAGEHMTPQWAVDYCQKYQNDQF